MILRNIFSIAGLNILKAVASVLVSFVVARAVDALGLWLDRVLHPIDDVHYLADPIWGSPARSCAIPASPRAEGGAAVALMGLTGVAGGLVLVLLARPIELEFAMAGLGSVLSGFGVVHDAVDLGSSTRAFAGASI